MQYWDDQVDASDDKGNTIVPRRFFSATIKDTNEDV